MALFKQWDNHLKSREQEPEIDLRKQVVFNSYDQDKEKFAKLCQICVECGFSALHKFFDKLFLAEKITEKLAIPENHKVLRRLRIRKIINERQWQLLYPTNKNNVSSTNFDLSLFGILVKYVCQLQKPWPNGWTGEPNELDKSTGAVFMRFQMVRRGLAQTSTMSKSQSKGFYRQLRKFTAHFGGDEVREKAGKCWEEDMDNEDQIYWIKQFQEWHAQEEEVWDREIEVNQAKMKRSEDIPTLMRRFESREEAEEDASPMMSRRITVIKAPDDNSWDRWDHIRTGMVVEERKLLNKYYERFLVEVKPDALMDHLTSNNLLSMEECNEIFSIIKSNEQMDILLEILVGKSGHTFDIFLEGLRKKYPELHRVIFEDFKNVMDAILASKPDGIPYCQGLLKQRYRTAFSRWTPLLWYKHRQVDLLDFYCPLKILDIKGNTVSPEALLASGDSSEKAPRWVVVEGEAGSGKSTLAQSLAYKWVNNENLFGKHFKLLFYINIKILAPNIKVMMMEQLFGSSFKLNERELWDVIEEHQSEVLFLFDSFEDNISDEIQNILFSTSLPYASVIIFTNTIFTPRFQDQFDRKYILSGFARRKSSEDFVQKYAQLAKRPLELFDGFLQKLKSYKKPDEENENESQKAEGTNSQPISRSNTFVQPGLSRTNTDASGLSGPPRPRVGSATAVKDDEAEAALTSAQKLATLRSYAQVPIYCSYFCFMTDLKLSLELTSWTALNEQFMTAVKMKLIEKDRESRFAVNKAYMQLAEMAFDTVKKGYSIVSVREDDDQLLLNFGVLQEATNLMVMDNRRYYFPNRLVQEFLAAKFLDTCGPDESARFFQNMNISRSLHSTVAFYCGMRKHDSESMSMRALLEKLVEYNKKRRALGVRDEDGHIAGNTTEGRIMDFQLSLECMALMEGKQTVANMIVATLPTRMLVKYKGIIPNLTIQGLAYLITLNSEHVVDQRDNLKLKEDKPKVLTELDIRLDQLSKQSADAYQRLAEAITSSKKIQVLRIFWKQQETMAKFLASVCLLNKSIKDIQCIDESGEGGSGATDPPISGRVMKHLRTACQNMTDVTSFTFSNCRSTPLVSAILKNLPLILEKLNLTGCDINIIASQELCEKLTNSKKLHSLVLSNVKIEGLAFNSFIKALCDNRSITSMNLSGVKLDNVCFFALAEALKMNHKLDHLDLRRVTIVKRSCEELAQVMKINTSLRRLQVTPGRVAVDGRLVLRKNAKPALVIEGIQELKRDSLYEDDLDIQKFQD